MTIDAQPDCFRVVRERPRDADLTANSLIAAGMRTESPPQAGLWCGPIRACAAQAYGAGGKPFIVIEPSPSFKGMRPAGASSFTAGALRTYPTRPLYAWVSVDFVMRRIDRGAESYEEGTQAVTLLNGKPAPACQVVLRTSELMPPLYGLDAGGRCVSQRNGPPLAFTDIELARAFGEWTARTRARQFAGIGIAAARTSSYQPRRILLPGNDPCIDVGPARP